MKVVWAEPVGHEDVRCGVRFLDPNPTFLPSVHAWLGRSGLDQGAMRD